MSLFKADNLESLKEFKDTDYKLGILEREQPEGAGSFFQKLMKNDFGIEGTLSSINLKEDLKNLVQEIIPNQLSSTEFYNYWLLDMETVCRTFLLIEKLIHFAFGLGQNESVDVIMLITYQGVFWSLMLDKVQNGYKIRMLTV